MFVKICGTTSEEDALLAVAMGADAVGFVFAPSPRQISPTKAADILLIQAFTAGSAVVTQAVDYGVDVVMIDAPSPGSGQVFDWRLADGVPDGMRLLLAGGLTPENVGEAIAAVHPWGVDVCTGVETSPGFKNAVKVKDFVAAAKAAGDEPYEGGDEMPYDWEEAGG